MNEFEKLINKNEYQVFLFSCPAYFPVNFFRHPWFVVNNKGKISRSETRHYKNKGKYLHINAQPPFEGVNKFFLLRKYLWKAKLISYLEGDKNSTILRVVEFIESSEQNYPFCKKYFIFGPNSNTYAQWVLNKFPEFSVKLSWRFFGKNYKLK